MTSRHHAPPDIAPDHLVVAAATLAAGCDFVEERVGARPVAGGKHAMMGTHNALLRAGPRLYLEVISIDPDGAKPLRLRWFDLDDPRMQAELAEGPRLVHWVARSSDVTHAAARSPIDLGRIVQASRGDFSWRITIPDDGHLPARGLVPTLIEWSGARHPADALPDAGVQMIALAGEHPEPAPVRAALAALSLSETLKVTYGRSPRLAAMLRTPRGTVTL